MTQEPTGDVWHVNRSYGPFRFGDQVMGVVAGPDTFRVLWVKLEEWRTWVRASDLRDGDFIPIPVAYVCSSECGHVRVGGILECED